MNDQHTQSGERIAKIIARAGLCSRREAEGWVEAGRVSVNGQTLSSPAVNVSPRDIIVVDGQPLAQKERTRLFLFHKPRGIVTTARDPQGRPTVFDALPATLPRVVAVGRLDINTEGLLLLTNDGGLARALELPSTGWLRRYRVRAHGRTDQAVLDRLAEGVTVDGVRYRGIEARLDREQGSNVWLTIGLREGKNREVKRVLEDIGLEVNRLIRISFGPFQLGEIEEGAVEEVKTRILKDQLGEKIAGLANADFDAPSFAEQAGPPPSERSSRRDDRRREDSDRPDRGARPARSQDAPRGQDARRGADSSRGRAGGKPRDSDRGKPRDRDNASKAGAPKSGAPERAATRPDPRKRKHVSVLREERDKDQGASARRRIEKGATTDRSGRAVTVERISAATGSAGGDRPLAKSKRNAERFAGAASARDGKTYKGTRGAKGGENARTAGGARGEERRERSPDRPRQAGGGDRWKGDKAGERKPREVRTGDVRTGGGSARSFSAGGGANASARPRTAAARPATGRRDGPGGQERRERSTDRPRQAGGGERWKGAGATTRKSDGAKPTGARPTGGRPAGAKPSSFKPSGAKPSGAKPSGGKPSGFKRPGRKPEGGAPSGRKPPGRGPRDGR